jgi:sugar phosphate isomerase/epimerase
MTISRRALLAGSTVAALAQTPQTTPARPAQRRRVPSWTPKLGVLGNYSEANLDWVKAEGFTSMELNLNPKGLDDNALAKIKERIAKSGIWVSSLNVGGNHIDPDPEKREAMNKYTIECIQMCGKLGIPAIGGQSGTIKGQPLAKQVDEIVRVYTERYFKVCEENKVKILWENYVGGPNIATGPLGWEALFKGFNDSPNVGLQFDPSHLIWQFIDPVEAAREFAHKIVDVHLKDTEIFWHVLKRAGIQSVDNVRWWRFRIPGEGSVDWKGFFTVLADVGYAGALNIENEDNFYYPNYENGNFTEQFKRGFHTAHEYLKTMVPPLSA